MLSNTAYKLKHDKKLRVAYFGGSITEGAGSSDPARTCYRALTTAHLRENYPDAEVTEIYAAIGGTGTSLGMFRLKRDVLVHNPDMIFVEFAVNDFGDTWEHVAPQTESIVRQIRVLAPMTDVVILFSTAEMVLEVLDTGGEFTSREAQRSVAAHYGIPTVDFGSVLIDRVKAENVPYSHYAPDTLHPGDNGYRVMTDHLLSVLDSWLKDGDSMVPHSVPEMLCNNASEIGDIVFCEDADLLLNGFNYVVEANDRFPGFIESTSAGDSFTYIFEGIGVGLYRVGGDSFAELNVVLDGTAYPNAKSWDLVDRSFHKMGAAIITKDLPRGKHTLTVTVPDVDEVRVRIGGFFVC